MGILKHLLFWPVTGPMFLTEFAFDKVQGVVKEELTDDTSIKAELMELQLMLELGDIDDDEYVRREAEVMAKLRDVRHWREQFGMGVSGGPVRVQAQDPAETNSPVSSGGPDGATRKPPEVVDTSGGATIDVNFDWD